jgi:hypothetical protein
MDPGGTTAADTTCRVTGWTVEWPAMTTICCPICGGEGWTCEDHAGRLINHALPDGRRCDGAGVACVCNPLRAVLRGDAERTEELRGEDELPRWH